MIRYSHVSLLIPCDANSATTITAALGVQPTRIRESRTQGQGDDGSWHETTHHTGTLDSPKSHTDGDPTARLYALADIIEPFASHLPSLRPQFDPWVDIVYHVTPQHPHGVTGEFDWFRMPAELMRRLSAWDLSISVTPVEFVGRKVSRRRGFLFGFLFVYFACFAATFPAQWHGRTLRRVRSESMNLGLPNQIASANAGKRFGFAGKSRVGSSPRPGVADPTLDRLRAFKFMSKLQTPKHKGTRSFLRIIGLVVASVGLIFLIIGMASFFSAFGGGGSPRLFWCCFVGMPLLFVGGVMCMFGFMGSVARYTAAEQVPVATDAINDLAEGTQGAVKTVARAVAEGVKEAQTERKQGHDPSA